MTDWPLTGTLGEHTSGLIEGGTAQATLQIDMKSRTDISGVEYREHFEVSLTGTAHAPKIFLAGPRRLRVAIRERELTRLDFGAIPPSTSSSASFWIRNVGDAPLTTQGVLIPGQSPFEVADVAIFPATLAPGSELEVVCTFRSPAAPGTPAASQFEVLSDDPLRPRAALSLSGRASGAHLSVSPEYLDFGNNWGPAWSSP